jgi:hypothetical protein
VVVPGADTTTVPPGLVSFGHPARGVTSASINSSFLLIIYPYLYGISLVEDNGFEPYTLFQVRTAFQAALATDARLSSVVYYTSYSFLHISYS